MRVLGSGKWTAHPHPTFLEVPPNPRKEALVKGKQKAKFSLVDFQVIASIHNIVQRKRLA